MKNHGLFIIVFLTLSIIIQSVALYGQEPYTKDYWDYPEDFVYGIMTVDHHYMEPFHLVFQELGLTNCRTSIPWDHTHPEREGDFNWSHEPNLDVIEMYGLEPVLLIAGTPTWASEIGEEEAEMFRQHGAYHLRTVAEPKRKYGEDYRRWIRAVAERYKGRIKYYEFWNEPNGYGWPIIVYDDDGVPVDFKTGGNAENYAYYLKITYETIKEVDPEAQVSLAGLCPGSKRMSFLEELYEMGANQYFDAVSIHPYGNLEVALMYEWIEDTRELMIEYGDEHKAIWITEWGWNVVPHNEESLKLKAERIKEALDYFRSTPWITMAHFHYLSGDPSDVWDLYRPHAYESFVKTRWEHEGIEREIEYPPPRLWE